MFNQTQAMVLMAFRNFPSHQILPVFIILVYKNTYHKKSEKKMSQISIISKKNYYTRRILWNRQNIQGAVVLLKLDEQHYNNNRTMWRIVSLKWSSQIALWSNE